jgi:glucosamine-6-phosphate deaminase
MNIIIPPGLQEWADAAAREIAQQIRARPDSVLGFATGNTTVRLHEALVTLSRRGEIDFSAVIAFILDDYIGLARDHPLCCRARLEAQLFQHVPIARANIHGPDCHAASLEQECREYERKIKERGGVDLQVLGLGLNGHIGFNEPGTPFESVTHVAEIAPHTQAAKAGQFGPSGAAPHSGITMGIKTIMQARKIMLLACGDEKAEIVARALSGPVTPEVPASVLQRHPNVNVILDPAAAGQLNATPGDLSLRLP